MMQHLLDKYDSYLGKLLGVLLIVVVYSKTENPIFLAFFHYFLFFMIGVAVFDTVKNFGEHENIFWKLLAIFSNALTAISCIFILQELYSLELPVRISSLLPILTIPNFMVFLGAFIVMENFLWSYVYDHL